MATTNQVGIHEFLDLMAIHAVVDVRSPREYGRGHIPGAHNLPLFDDAGRAAVGTLYNNAGREAAINLGLELTGPRMKGFADQAKEWAVTGHILVYCWRGGMRSGSMAWLFNTSGLTASVLKGGYKEFRRYALQSFERSQPAIILGGMTGSGKSDILKALRKIGEQVIDLEYLARHKGSVFGHLGQEEQPANQQFENELAMQWRRLDPSRPVWLEDESINIGRVSIPRALFEKMRAAPMVCVEMDQGARAERIFNEYACFDRAVLASQSDRLTRRLGSENQKNARAFILDGKMKEAILILLDYYDKLYRFSLKNREKKNIHILRLPGPDAATNARLVAGHALTKGFIT